MRGTGMRLRQIEVFYHVYKHGSISRAAQELAVAQPSVSKVLRHLEDVLGFDLFRRERGRLVATEAASELFDEVSRIYDLISQLRRTAVNIRNRRGGHIRLGTLPSLGLALVPTAIAQLHSQNPELTFSVSTLHSDEIIASLLEKRCDVCVGFDLDAGDRIESAAIAQCEFLLVTQAGTIESTDGTVPLSTIENLPFIGIRDSGPAAKLLGELLDREGLAPNEIISAQTYHIAMSFVDLGLGVAVVDSLTASAKGFSDLDRFRFTEPVGMSIKGYFLKGNPKQDLLTSCLNALRDAAAGNGLNL